MSFSLRPKIAYGKLTDISPEELSRRGIRLLLLDIDNTVSPYKNDEPTHEVCEWVSGVRKAGIRLFFISNNRGERPSLFSEKLGIEYIKKAGKPFTRKTRKTLAKLGCKPGETAMIGDQIFADVLCANMLGCVSILVEPIKFTNALLAIRYFFELPFRKMAHEDYGRRKKRGSHKKALRSDRSF